MVPIDIISVNTVALVISSGSVRLVTFNIGYIRFKSISAVKYCIGMDVLRTIPPPPFASENSPGGAITVVGLTVSKNRFFGVNADRKTVIGRFTVRGQTNELASTPTVTSTIRMMPNS